MTTSQVCQRRSNDIGGITVCDSEGIDGDYDYLLNVTSPGPNEPHLVSLIVRPT